MTDSMYYAGEAAQMHVQGSSRVSVPEEHDALSAKFTTTGRNPVPDLVNQPPHYNQGNIECIDYLRDNLSPEGFRGYLEGNVKKYAHRFRHKGGVQDLEKSQWYLDRLIKELKNG